MTTTTDPVLRDALQALPQPWPGTVLIEHVLACVERETERLRTDNAWLDRHYRQATEADEAVHEKVSAALGLDDGVSWDALVDKVRQVREENARLTAERDAAVRAARGIVDGA